MLKPPSFSSNVSGMYRVWFSIFLLAGATLVGGCRKADAPPKKPSLDDLLPHQAQPKLPTIKLWLGPAEINAEMAVTSREEMTGMMFRTNVAENEGMIFVMPEPQQASYWMKNCYVPLSIAYIAPDGTIREIHHLEPQNTNAVVSATDDIQFALETAQGWFKRHDVGVGMVVRTERGSLQQTFFPNR